MPPMLRSLLRASLAMSIPLVAEQAGLHQTVGANTKTCNLRDRVWTRLLLLYNRACPSRRTLEDVREEAERLVWRHGLLILVLASRV